MVEIPRFYFQITDTATERDFCISERPLDGYQVSPRHAPTPTRPNGYDRIYVSAYTVSAGYRSISGQPNLVNITRAAARAGCSGRGANYCQYDFATLMTLWLLYIVETANWNSQTAVGNGNVGTSAALPTGDADGVAFHSGSMGAAAVNNRGVKYRHMENLWGNIYQWVDGINFQNQNAFVCTDPAAFADDVGPTAAYAQVPYSLPSNGSGWIRMLGYDAAMPWAMIPTNFTGGSATTFIPDQGVVGWAGWYVLFVGGFWNGSTGAGLFYFDASGGSSVAPSNIGGRLLVLP